MFRAAEQPLLNFRSAANFSENSNLDPSKSNSLPIHETPDHSYYSQLSSSVNIDENSSLSAKSKKVRQPHKHKLTKARAAALSVFVKGFVVRKLSGRIL